MRAEIDSRRGNRPLIVPGLVALALVQAGAIVLSVTRPKASPGSRPPDLVIGERIPAIPGRDSLARSTSLSLHRANPGWTVLLAFSPTCAWCDSVAPLWKRWSSEASSGVYLAGISSGDPAAAHRYAQTHGWHIGELLVVDSAMTGPLGRQLTRKTPWLFLFDSTGTLRYSGHGSEVGLVDSLLGHSK